MTDPDLSGSTHTCLREERAVAVDLMELIDDAIENVLWAHEPRDNDSRCQCGATNNMDGDVLHSHRMGLLSEAVRGVLVEANLVEEEQP